ncbi:MAG: hypothetical protein ACK55I_36175, partial [bacterium]
MSTRRHMIPGHRNLVQTWTRAYSGGGRRDQVTREASRRAGGGILSRDPVRGCIEDISTHRHMQSCSRCLPHNEYIF